MSAAPRSPRPGAIPLDVIINAAARASGHPTEELIRSRYDRSVVHWRRVIVLVARLEGWTNTAIAITLNCRPSYINALYLEATSTTRMADDRRWLGFLRSYERLLTELLPPLITLDELTDYVRDQRDARQ